MDMNPYLAQKLAEARLRDLRAASARAALLRSLRSGRLGIRAMLGEALIRAGRWMLREHATSCPRRRRVAFAGR